MKTNEFLIILWYKLVGLCHLDGYTHVHLKDKKENLLARGTLWN